MASRSLHPCLINVLRHYNKRSVWYIVRRVSRKKVGADASTRIGGEYFMYGGLFSGILTVHALSLGFKKAVANEESEDKQKGNTLIINADRLYDDNNVEGLYDLLIPNKYCSNAEVLWRLARAVCEKGKRIGDKKAKELCYREALSYAEKALECDDQNFACHKWYAFMLNYLTPFMGTKESLTFSYVIRDHLERAMELNPKDATTTHSLGYWCYVFADLKWYERKLAAVLFATPPESTFKQALGYFLKAEEMDPEFYSMNLLMIGKTYLKLNNSKMAYLYLTKAADYVVKSEDDKAASTEAAQLLQDLAKSAKT